MQVCTCLRQLPVLCRTVLCAPPQGCRSLRVGDACCEWVCDHWEGAEGGVSELGLRLVASAVTAILSLSLLFFLIYRLRQRKLRGRQNHLEAESFRREESRAEEFPGRLGSFQLDNLKPHDRILLRRPFPPSYSEAVSGGLEPGAAPPYNREDLDLQDEETAFQVWLDTIFMVEWLDGRMDAIKSVRPDQC